MLVASVLVARVVGTDGFGSLAAVRSTVEMVSTLLLFGIGATVSKHVAQLRFPDPDRAGRIAALAIMSAGLIGATFAGFLWLGAPTLGSKALQDPSLQPLLRLAAPSLLFIALSAALGATLAGLEAFAASAVATSISAAIGAAAVAGGAWAGGLWGAILGLVCYQVVTAACFALSLWRETFRLSFRIRWAGATRELPLLYRFGLPAMASGAIGGPVVWATYALAYRQPGGAALLGLFNGARLLELVFSQLSSSFHQPLLVMVSQSTPEERAGRIRVSVLTSWTLGSAAGLLACTPELLALVLGSGFGGQSFLATTSIVCLTSYLMLYKQGLNRLVVTEDRVGWGVRENLWWGLLVISFAPPLTRSFGAPGLAAAFAAAYAIDMATMAVVFVRHGLLPKDLVWSWRSACVSCTVALATLLGASSVSLGWRLLFLLLASPATVYCLWSLWMVRSSES